MNRLLASIFGVVLFAASISAQVSNVSKTSAWSESDIEFFERKVRPILAERCWSCHAGDEVKAGLHLDSRASILAGGDSGPAVIPGDADASLLVDAVNYGDTYQMPPKSKLPDDEIVAIVEWVERGAPWPEFDKAHQAESTAEFDLVARKKSHWAWQSLRDVPVPAVSDESWPANDIDRFILAGLEAVNVDPAAAAKPAELMRRLHFDLIGLPPPIETVESYAKNPTEGALEQIVDDLLESRHFGERWARHWLDLMRYAETRGHEFDYPIPNAWQYRDYVIRALNADVPYNDFVIEHLAGDLVASPRRHPTQGFNESVLATGFWFLNDWVHSPVDIRKDEAERFDNAIDVWSKAFLGLTISCARCHDHKFDAISQEDYYALVGFLRSSDYRQVRFESFEHNLDVAKQLDALLFSARDELARELVSFTSAVRGNLPQILANAVDLANSVKEGSTDSEIVQRWAEQIVQARNDTSHPLHPIAESPSSDEVHRASAEVNGEQTADAKGLVTVVVDFDSDLPAWQVEGPAFGSGPLPRGTILPGKSAVNPFQEVVDRGRAELRSELTKLKLAEGAETPVRAATKDVAPGMLLRLPLIELDDRKLFYLMRGAAQIHAVVDSHRMIDGPLHRNTFITVAHDDEWRWVEHDVSRYAGHHALVEFAPLKDHPLAIAQVVQARVAPPIPKLNQLRPQIGGATHEAAVQQWANAISTTIEQFEANARALSPADLKLVEWAANHPRLWSDEASAEIGQALQTFHERRKELLNGLRRTSMVAPAIFDAGSEDEYLFVRGNSSVPADIVPRRFLAAIGGPRQPQIAKGSGRLELARRLLDPSNPLPPRVIVNRVWHHMMGRGIVPSVDNFGVLGHTPTHPELLDYLAHQFVDDGWSIKRLVRSIVLARTYQMSAAKRDDEEAFDPTNRLFHRMNLRRIEAEALRDAMLTMSGSLNREYLGKSVPVYLTEFMEGRGRPEKSGPFDGAGRRTVYLAVRRNFLSPMMTAFDAPQPSSPQGRRTVSNVPGQALMLLNDPFIKSQAAALEERIRAEPDAEARVSRLYRLALAREPTGQELRMALDFVATQSVMYENGGDKAAWADLCHVMFNTKEFLFR